MAAADTNVTDAGVWKVIGPIILVVTMAATGIVLRNNSSAIDTHESRIRSLEESRVHDAIKLTEIDVNTKNSRDTLTELKGEFKADIGELKRSVDNLHERFGTLVTPSMMPRAAQGRTTP